jgi:tRNA(His) 5'-end guanylyltransferase
MKENDLAKRMKSYYQDAYNIKLPKWTNVIIRLDGKAFGNFTRGLKRPFDAEFAEDMDATAKYLMKNIQGCKFAYVQSDEISLVLTDYDTLKTSAWFDNKLQKIVSVSASMATVAFNRARLGRIHNLGTSESNDPEMFFWDSLADWKWAEFDSRAFIIPFADEVVNYFLWRQQDATRTSISMAAQSVFSHSELQGKSTNEMQEMLMTLKGINWNDYPIRFKRGGTVIKMIEEISDVKFRSRLILDDPPIFSQDRDYILQKIKPTDEN